MEYKQDMPPPGGYNPITYRRVPLKPKWNPFLRVGIVFGITGIGLAGFHYTKDQIINERIEMRCGRFALFPMLFAERDRMLLKQLKRNRDAEEKIMKDVQGWEVGKWNHMPIYLTLKPEDYFKPQVYEYYAHAPTSDFKYAFRVLKDN